MTVLSILTVRQAAALADSLPRPAYKIVNLAEGTIWINVVMENSTILMDLEVGDHIDKLTGNPPLRLCEGLRGPQGDLQRDTLVNNLVSCLVYNNDTVRLALLDYGPPDQLWKIFLAA
ncbi:hypothetical protein K438DRAFT_1783650 [Mycena galopus ATCC 62051]|nr:hypothetical protein K438DRAFT_1783650 [Mycena galopus ATCC 62051]